MSRYPALSRSELDEEQTRVYDETTEFCQQFFGQRRFFLDDKDRLNGPFALLLYTPSLMRPWLSVFQELAKIKELPREARETAILATGSNYQAIFEIHDHSVIAEERKLLTPKQTELIRRGEKPTGEDALNENCEVAYDTAIELSKGRGPLKEASFQRLVKQFGLIGAAALIHYVGAYCYTSVMLNAADAPVTFD